MSFLNWSLEIRQQCDSLAKEIPKFQSMPDINVFSDSAQPEQQEHVIVESKQPTMKKSVKRFSCIKN
jgi:hypothetical protein